MPEHLGWKSKTWTLNLISETAAGEESFQLENTHLTHIPIHLFLILTLLSAPVIKHVVTFATDLQRLNNQLGFFHHATNMPRIWTRSESRQFYELFLVTGDVSGHMAPIINHPKYLILLEEK